MPARAKGGSVVWRATAAAAWGTKHADPGQDAAAADEVDGGKHSDGEEHPECPDEELAADKEAGDADVLLLATLVPGPHQQPVLLRLVPVYRTPAWASRTA